MPAASKRYWTAADVRALIEETRQWPRYELLDGELLVTPAPASPHQFAITAMLSLLDEYCRRERLGAALASPADIELLPESIMQPDVFVVPEQLIPEDRPPGHRSRRAGVAPSGSARSTAHRSRCVRPRAVPPAALPVAQPPRRSARG